MYSLQMLPIDPLDFNEKLQKIGDTAEAITRVGGLIRWLVGALVSVAIALGGCGLWVYQTTSALAATQIRLEQMDAATQSRVTDWLIWRREMDRTTTRLLANLENQQKLMERLTDRVDGRAAK